MSFFDTDRWNEIWQTISRNRKRSVMTALGIFWGIFMLTILLGAGMGLGRLFRSQLGDMSTNTLMLNPGQTSVPYKGMPKDRWWRITNEDAYAIRKLPEVKYASGIYWGGEIQASHNSRKGNHSLMGYMPDYQKINPQRISYGRFINDVDILLKRKVCVIGSRVQKDLFPGIEDPTGKIIQIKNAYFTVVGVMLKQGSMMTFSDVERTVVVPISLAQQMYGGSNQIHMLAVAGDDDTPSKEIENACKEQIFARHLIAPDDKKALFCMATAEIFEKVQGLFMGISVLTWVVGLGTLIAGVVGVSNIMLVLVKERTQEIGIRRALGAPPLAIILQILSESFILTFIAGVVGLAVGVGVLSLVDSIFYQTVTVAQQGPEISWQISFGMGMLSLAILVTGSLLAGVIPAVRALKIKAVDAIREE